MSPLAAPDPDRVRSDILHAADLRFQQFGYGKTTMAEIARDCSMSAANLYRYFDNKADIAAELARGCLGSNLMHLQQVLEDERLSAPEKIRAWMVTSVERTWAQWSEQPRMNELVDDVCGSRGDIVQEHYSAKRQLLEKMLAEATARGELSVADPNAMAGAVLTACISFDVPHFMHMCTFEEHQAKALQLADAMLAGMLRGASTEASSDPDADDTASPQRNG